MKWSKKRWFALGMLLVLLLFYATHQRVLPYALKWLDVGETPKPSTATFALLGNNDTRPFVAAAIYNAGLTEEILLGVSQPSEENPQLPPTNECYRRVLLHRGVPPEHIRFLGGGVTNTMNEGQVLREYFEQNPDATLSVVTTHFHTRRTRWALRRALGKYADQMHFVSAPNDDFDASNWWLGHEGFEYVVMEYIKLFAYWFVYGDAIWYLATATFLAISVLCLRNRRKSQNSTMASDAAEVQPET